MVTKNTGIYKITSPSGKIYIGQSINIYNRWKSKKEVNKVYGYMVNLCLLSKINKAYNFIWVYKEDCYVGY